MFRHLLKTLSNNRGAITFDGADDLVLVTDAASLQNLAAITYSCWFNITSWGSGSNLRFIDKSAWRIYTNIDSVNTTDTNIEFDVGYDLDVNPLQRTSVTGVYGLGTLNHLLITWDGSSTATNAHIYVNGTEVSYETPVNGGTLRDTDIASNLYIGNRADLARTFNGSITEVAIWNVVLGADDIAALYGSGAPLKATPEGIHAANLMMYLPMDDGTVGTSADGDTVADHSGQGNNGTGNDGANNTGLQWATDPLSYGGRIPSLSLLGVG